MKTYTITLPAVFPGGHPREGEYTGMDTGVLLTLVSRPGTRGRKTHAVLPDYGKWASRMREVDEGKAVIAIKTWKGKAHATGTEGLLTIDSHRGAGVERLDSLEYRWVGEPATGALVPYLDVGGHPAAVEAAALARNDGLDFGDWDALIRDILKYEPPLAILHFTDFRYIRENRL